MADLHDGVIYVKEKKRSWWKRFAQALFMSSIALVCGVVLTVSFAAVNVPEAFQEYSQPENYTIHYDEETFNVMRGEYARETSGEFDEDKYCMYGEANSTGIYIKELVKASAHQAGDYNITTDYGYEMVEGVSGICPRPQLPFSRASAQGVYNYPSRAVSMAVNFIQHEALGQNYTMRFLGDCHSHPPDNSNDLSGADYKSWNYEPIKCVMYREKPYIYTNQRYYTHANQP